MQKGGRLPLLKQKETLEFKANIAILWAATLQFLLTQLKEQLEKDSAKHKELSSTVLIDQSAYKESKQILASPSTIIWDHASGQPKELMMLQLVGVTTILQLSPDLDHITTVVSSNYR